MPAHSSSLLHHLRRLLPRAGDESGDAALLERFTTQSDQEAFAVLVARHGPMVLAVCRRLLADPHAVEDAFQATFLVLARRAGTVRRPEALAGWLHQVARRAALEARAALARRRQREQPAGDDLAASDAHPDPLAEVTGRELLALVDEEVHRLPRAYQLPLILCCLEGRSQDEAARLLGWSPGSVKGRLERGRALLHARLARRGLAPLAPLPALLAPRPLPASLLAATLRAAGPDGTARAGAVALAGALARGGAARLAVPALLLLAAGLLAVALAGQRLPSPVAPAGPAPAAKDVPPQEAPLPADPLPHGAVARLGTQRLRHAGRVGCVVFAPDGKTLASAAADQTIALWDAATGQRRASFGYCLGELGFDGADRLVFDPNGKFLAVGKHVHYSWAMSGWGPRPRLLLLDPVTGKEQRGWWKGLSGSVCSLAVSGDGQTLAAADEEGGLLVWDVPAGKEKFQPRLPADRSYLVCFSPDSKTLVVAPRRRRAGNGELPAEVHLWDVGGGKKRLTFSLEGKDGVTALGMGRDPDLLGVVASGRAQLWRLSTGKKVRDLLPAGDARALAFSPDGKFVAVGLFRGSAGEVYLVDPATGKQRLRLAGFADSLAFSPDGRRLATAGADCAVRLWDVRTGRPALFPAGANEVPTHSASRLAFSGDARTIVTGSDDGVVRVWDARSGAVLSAHPLRPAPRHSDAFGCVRITPAGQALATPEDLPHGPRGAGPAPVLWDARTGKVLLRLPPVVNEERRGYVCGVEVSPDGRTLAHARGDVIVLTDVATGRPIRQWRCPDGNVSQVRFCAGGARLAVVAHPGKGDAVLHLHDAATGKALARIQDRSVWAFALSPDGRTVATAGSSSVIVFWDGETGKELRRTPGGSFQALAFSPDGTLLASGERTGQVRLWDVRTGEGLFTLNAQAGGVRCLAFADSRRLATAGLDTTVLVWDLAAAVRGARAGARPTRGELQTAWDELGSSDLATAFRAAMTLRLDLPGALAPVRDQVRAVPEVSAQRLRALVGDLDDDDFDTRQKASRELERLGPPAEPALRRALQETRSLEVRRRAEDLLARIGPHSRRMLRLVPLLAEAGTPQARALLRELAGGAAGAPETRAARAALRSGPEDGRLNGR